MMAVLHEHTAGLAQQTVRHTDHRDKNMTLIGDSH